MADTSAPGLYSPLTSRQIRLFSFHERDLEHLHLQVFDLGNCPTYAAISYRWGDATKRTIINTDGIATDTHFNLATALRSVISQMPDDEQDDKIPLGIHTELFETEDQTPIKHFWADGICINQDALAERGRQVQMMGDVFSQAVCVFAHLMDERCTAGIRVLNEIYSLPSELTETSHTTLADIYTRNLMTLGPLTSEPYWRRAWIIQEIVRGREVCVLCGTQALSLAPLKAAIVVNSAVDLQKSNPFIGVLSRKWDLRVLDVRNKGRLAFWDLPEWLYLLQDAQCSDERDRIYSLLGCIDWRLTREIEPLKVDYTISTGELFRRIVDLHIATGGHRIALLQHALHWKDADHSVINSFLKAQHDELERKRRQ